MERISAKARTRIQSALEVIVQIPRSQFDLAECIEQTIVRLWNDHRVDFAIAFTVCMVCYGYNAAASVFEQETFGSVSDRLATISANYSAPARYLLYAISRYVGTASFTPFLTLCVTASLLSFSAMLFVRLFVTPTHLASAMGLAVFVATPFFSLAIPLWLWSIAFGVSYLTATLAAYLLLRRSVVVVPTILLTLTLLNYQPSIGLFLTSFGCHAIWVLMNQEFATAVKAIVLSSIKVMSALFVSGTVYFVALKLSQYDISAYTNQQTGFETSAAALLHNISTALLTLVLLPAERGVFHTHFPWVLGGLAALFSIATVTRSLAVNREAGARALAIAAIAFFCVITLLAIAPFNLVLGEQVWFDRVLVSYASVFAFLVIVTLSVRNSLVNGVAFLGSVVTLWWFVQFDNVNSFSQYVMNIYDYATTNRLITYIVSSNDYDSSVRYEIVAVGANWSMISPAAGAPDYRPIIHYQYVSNFRFPTANIFAMNGLPNVVDSTAPDAVRARYAETISNLATWPSPRSVRIVDGRYILVRFK